ncbi:MAG: hypothetical protein HKN28_06575 [Alphaproteobacteria bacterium]|nr:hypothetical protein [Alphaproteobacteria bacterium]
MDKITAHGLAKVSFHGDVKDSAVAMALEDSEGQKLALTVTPQTVTALLPPLLGLAKEWATHSDLDIDKVTGLKNSLPADRIEFAKGRNETEIAVRFFIGAVELSFILPSEELFTKISELGKRINKVSENSQ